MSIKRFPARQATLNDVAKLSSVSYQTVSRVINNSQNVSNKTRSRVLEAIETLGYQPNLVARSLKTRRSLILEVVVFGVDTFIPHDLMEAIGRAAKASGYRVMFSSIDDEDVRDAQSLLHRLNSRACDGALITAPVENTAFEYLLEASPSVPIVLIRNKTSAPVPSVLIDQELGSRMATQYLIDLGHREIAEISGPLNWHEAAIRHESFLATLRANQLTAAALVESPQWMPANGYQAAQELVDGDKPFSALVVANDYLALGAILALSERGLRVPQDVSIVGFDDTAEAAFYRPALTTIRQDYVALGRQSIQYLVDLVNDPDLSVHQRVLKPRLIERQSARPGVPS